MTDKSKIFIVGECKFFFFFCGEGGGGMEFSISYQHCQVMRTNLLDLSQT